MSQRYTAAQVAQAIVDADGIVTHAAKRLGCTRKTVYRYIEKYVTVQDALRDSRSVVADKIESTLLSEALGSRLDNGQYEREPNTAALIFVAKTHPAMRARGYASRHEHTGANGDAINVNLTWEDMFVRGDDDDGSD